MHGHDPHQTTEAPPTPPRSPARRAGHPACTVSGAAAWSPASPSGLADYFDVDPTIVRIGFVALAFLGGLAVPLYVAGWLLIPDEDTDLSVAEELLARERARGRTEALHRSTT